MSGIATVTLNPAIDMEVEVNNLSLGETNFSELDSCKVAGKGVNVSHYLKMLGYRSINFGFWGQNNVEFWNNFALKNELNNNLVFVNGDTRTNIKLIDNLKGKTTVIKQKGFTVEEQDYINLKNKIKEYENNYKVVMIAGSNANGLVSDIYKDLLKYFSNSKIVLETRAGCLFDALKCDFLPYAIKFNAGELGLALGKDLSIEKNLIAEVKKLQEQGIRMVVVFRETKGFIFAHDNEMYRVVPMTVLRPRYNTGVGDAIITSLIMGLYDETDNFIIIDNIVKFALLALSSKGSWPFDNINLEQIENHFLIDEIR